MKKHVLCNVAFALCAVLVLCLFATVPAQATTDTDSATMTFESDATTQADLEALGWTFVENKGNNTNATPEIDASIVYDAAKGSKVLKVETKSDGSKYAKTPLVYVKDLTDIKVTFDIKGSHRTWTYLQQFNANKDSLGNLSSFSSAELWNQMKDGNGNPKNEWVTVTLTATVTAGTEYVSLWIPYVGADCTDGVFYLDNITIEHNHTFDKEVATDEYFASGATTTQGPQYYKSCACGAKGTATFTHGDPLPTQATTAPATTAPATTAPATTAPATTAGTAAGTTSATVPEAGDSTSTVGMLAILLLAVTGMVAMFVGNKKGKF